MNPVSLVFTTYNRSAILNKALSAALCQTIPVEIIVVDDASTDDTEFMIKSCFPEIIYYKSDKNYGPSYQRNVGAKKASSEIIFFFDDDTVISDEHILSDTLKDFTLPQIGAVAIPFINILKDNIINNKSPDKNRDYICHSFVGAAFAVRKEVFFSVNGFREEYFYMGEEGDFCLRMLACGYYVKMGTSNPALHYQLPNTISFRADYFGRRNNILFLYLNAPLWIVPFSIIYTIFRGIFYGVKVGRFNYAQSGIWDGLKILLLDSVKGARQPIEGKVFSKFRLIKKYEPLLLSRFITL